MVGSLRVKEVSRTDTKAKDTASDLWVCPFAPDRLSKHLEFFETTETTNQHDELSGPLPSYPWPLLPQSPSNARPLVGI